MLRSSDVSVFACSASPRAAGAWSISRLALLVQIRLLDCVTLPDAVYNPHPFSMRRRSVVLHSIFPPTLRPFVSARRRYGILSSFALGSASLTECVVYFVRHVYVFPRAIGALVVVSIRSLFWQHDLVQRYLGSECCTDSVLCPA